jgi:valyl-tRNA synthetase
MDYEIGQRHNLEIVNGMNEDGSMHVPGLPYDGMPALEARKRIVEELKAQGLLVKEEPYTHEVGHCDRCHAVIEPLISEQWWLSMAEMRDRSVEASQAGQVRWHPERYERTYLDWLRGLRDWNIGRQLWLGHRVPVYYCANGHTTVSVDTPEKCEECGNAELTQDPDVLDTWFSSQLWPFSVFGWPKMTQDLRDFYPTDVLVTGYDILFFWVARMIMAGLHFMGRKPFSVVPLHGLVRLAGEKMSKTRGNVIDPLVAIAEFGADALRFTYASSATSGTTVTLERERLSGSRNFATKLWNAARFTLAQLDGKPRAEVRPGLAFSPPDRWILSRLSATAADVDRYLNEFRFDEASQALYAFLWHELCDGYLEMVKPVLSGRDGDDGAREIARGVLERCLADSLALLHPFMPFLTEEIWEKLTGRPGTLIVSPYPSGDPAFRDPAAEAAVERMRALVTRVRNFRGERRVSPTEPVVLSVEARSEDEAREIRDLEPLLRHLARLADLRFGPAAEGEARDVVSGVAVGLALPSATAAGNREQSARTLAQLDGEIAELSAKLQNPAFLERAPEPVVAKVRRRLLELEQRRAALGSALSR